MYIASNQLGLASVTAGDLFPYLFPSIQYSLGDGLKEYSISKKLSSNTNYWSKIHNLIAIGLSTFIWHLIFDFFLRVKVLTLMVHRFFPTSNIYKV